MISTTINLILLCFLLVESGSLADLVRRKDGHATQDDTMPTPTSAAHSSPSQTLHPATFATPITTALPNHKIPLYIPALGPFDNADMIKVDYWGPANGGSTVYQVVMSAHSPQATAIPPITATLIEDATNAELLGGQRTMTIDGKEREVYAAASCGFADGLQNGQNSKAAGYCEYRYVADHVTSTWASAVTEISAQTSIVPSTLPREPASTQIVDDAQRLTSSSNRVNSSKGLLTAALVVLTIHIHSALG